MRDQVVILGAGLAGLAAADRLINKGEKPLIIEKEDEVGGLSRSITRNGFIFDLGGHRFLPRNKETADFVNSLFHSNDRLFLKERLSKIYLNKKFLHYPPDFSDILKNLGVVTCLKCGIDSAYARARHFIRKTPEASLKDWLVNRFGYTLYNIYFGPYSFKLWGRMTSHISSEWASQRISVPHIGAAIRSLFTAGDSSFRTYSKEYLYPKGGIGKISERIALKVTKAGGRILVRNKVIKIGVESDGFTIDSLTPEGVKERFSSPKIISSVPITEVVRMLDPRPPQKVMDAAGSLCFRAIRFLNLMLNMPQVTKNTWIYVPERKYIFFRIQEFPNWDVYNSPAGKTSLTLEIACDKGSKLWNMADEDLLKICIADLKKMGIDVENKIIDHFCLYAEHAYPVYSLRYKRDLNEIYDFMKTLKNLVLCGRQGLFRYINMDAAIESGFDSAEAVDEENKRTGLMNPDEEKEHLETNLYLRGSA